LREALARSDHDFVLSEPRSRSAKRRISASGVLLGCLRWAYRAAAYPNRVAAALLIGVLIAILMNALVFQHSHHPAPLFGRTVPVPAAPAPVVVDKPEPAPAASVVDESPKPGRDAITLLLKTGSAPHTTSAPNLSPNLSPSLSPSLRKPANPEASEAKPAPVRDPISQFLKVNAPQQPSIAEPSKTVLGVQRALVKLGFVLKPDGFNGAATRQALEQFEHDRGLPVKGELTPKVLHELAAQSGQSIE
jgi:hypothetical protein